MAKGVGVRLSTFLWRITERETGKNACNFVRFKALVLLSLSAVRGGSSDYYVNVIIKSD